jgi:hypothetical protein
MSTESKTVQNLLTMSIAELQEKKATLLEQIEGETTKGKELWKSLLDDVQHCLDIKQAEVNLQKEKTKQEKLEKQRQKDLEKAIAEEARKILQAEEEAKRMEIVRAEAVKRAEEERRRLVEEAKKRQEEQERLNVLEVERKRKEEEFERDVLAEMKFILQNDIERKEAVRKAALARLAAADPELRKQLLESISA